LTSVPAEVEYLRVPFRLFAISRSLGGYQCDS
jgi:hypothetical protein